MGIKLRVKQKIGTVTAAADRTIKKIRRILRKILVIVLLVALPFILYIVFGRIAAAKILEKSNQVFDSIEKKYGITINAGTMKFQYPTITKNTKITFKKINVSYSGRSLAEMEECALTGFSSFLFSDTKKIDIKCLNSSLYADGGLKTMKFLSKIPKQDASLKKSDGKKKKIGKSVSLSTSLTIFSGRTRLKYSLEAEISPENGRIFLQETEKENGGKTEVLFFPASKKVSARIDGIDLSTYRELIKSRTPLEISEGKIDGQIDIEPDKEGNFLCKSDISVKNIAFFHPIIDSQPFKIPLFRFSGEITADKNKKLISTKDADISLGGINALFSGSYSKNSKSFSIKTESANLNKLETLIHDRTFENYLFGGTLELLAEYSEKEGEDPLFSVSGNLSEPKQLSDRLDYLKYGFDYTVTNENGSQKTIFVGEQNPDFTPIAFIPSHLVWAVVVSEDAGFFVHKGIDFQELDAAVKDNIKKHRMRGGSTISQQLAKNLFLNRDKTLLRKFREVLLSIELDATLSKERMLEIYLNIIEWAPGVFGITQAAYYYFGKTPGELTPLESAYLASVIPGPSKYHYQFLTKNISENWYRNLYRILNIMNETGHLSLEEYIEATRQTINFRESGETLE